MSHVENYRAQLSAAIDAVNEDAINEYKQAIKKTLDIADEDIEDIEVSYVGQVKYEIDDTLLHLDGGLERCEVVERSAQVLCRVVRRP